MEDDATDAKGEAGGRRPDFWSARPRVLPLLLALLTGFLFVLTVVIVGPFLKAVLWALTLAVAFFPLHKAVQRRIPKPSVAAGLSSFVVTLVFLVPVVFVISNVGVQANRTLEKIQTPEAQQSIEDFLQDTLPLKDLMAKVDVKAGLKKIAPAVVARLPSVATRSIWMLTEAVIVVFILFFLFRDPTQFLQGTRRLLPLTEEECTQIFRRGKDAIHATFFGHLLMAVIQGTLGGFVFLGLGLPAPLLWGALMAFFAVLPVLGAAIVWIPAALFLILSGSWGKAIFLIFFGTIIISLVDNLLYPFLVGKRIREHTLLVFLAIVGGIIVFGAAGIVAGPLILALTDSFVEIWRARLQAAARARD